MDLIFKVLRKVGAPPFFSQPIMAILAEQTPQSIGEFPNPTFTSARNDKHGRKMPQTIAHRGYKSRYPENSLCAFKAAVDAGVHALETDVHVSKDGTVVLSHDGSLQRCFGVNEKVGDCDWEYLKTLRCLAEPHVPLARLQDLIEYLAEPGMEKIWLLLDIKIDNDAQQIMRLMSEVVKSVKVPTGTRWEDRIVLGCWAAKYIPLCSQYFPGFPVSNIGFSIPYSRQFLAVPNLSFNLLQASLVSPWGSNFIDAAKADERRVYSWTVNDEKNMDWCIRKGFDGVITDDPKAFLDVCEDFQEDVKPSWPPLLVLNFMRINFFVVIFGLLFWKRHGFGLDPKYLVKKNN